MIYYSADRRGLYSPDREISLTQWNDVSPSILQDFLNNNYPEGLSTHGEMYLLKNTALATNTSVLLEMLLENVRLAKFPEKPSRLQSMFACRTIEEVRSFQNGVGANAGGHIYEVVSDAPVHVGDMGLYTLNCTSIILMSRLDMYWRGETLPADLAPEHQPFWEVIVPLPAMIGRQVA